MNRAVRRQQRAQEAKQKAAAARSGPRVSIPKATAPGRAARAERTRGGLLGWRPRFLMDIISELRKVVWPSREDTLHMAVVVVIVTIIFGAILGAIDIGFGWVIDRTLLDQDALFR
jgi:preprotein translocase subunit SecE